MKKIVARRKIQEGESVWDSISAFGRQAADTATLGGYKYARAGVDYAAKNALSLAGYGKGTTYQKELDQEKEKLAHDEAEHQQASSAGKLAGIGAMTLAPELPAVGGAAGGALAAGEKATKAGTIFNYARKALGLEETLAGTGASMDGMSAPFSAMGQEIEAKRNKKPIPLGKTMGSYVDEEKSLSLWKHNKRSGLWDHQRNVTPETKDEWLKTFTKDEPDAHFHVSKNKPKHNPTVKEDAPANAAGGGNIAGIGVGPQGEPGRPAQLMPMARRGKKFMGVETFVVPSRVFNQIREAKRKGKHWRKYLDEDDTFYHIRMEAKKNKKGAIIIEDENTGALIFARYGKEV